MDWRRQRFYFEFTKGGHVMKKKLYKISFFLLLIALFTFLEWQIDKEVEKIEPVSHIAVGR